MIESNTTIEKFGINIKYFLITNENGTPIKMVTTGGIEVIDEANTDKEIHTMVDKLGKSNSPIAYRDGMGLPFKYVETEFSVDKLKELLKYKSIKSLSKEKALEINKDIKSKNDLVNDIVYITDKEPMTNSLALAKQFDLNHMDVVKKILELGVMYPSTLMKIKYDVYSSTIKQSSKAKSDIKDDRPRKESSLHGSKTITERETYDTFIHIPEDVYYQFLKKLGTPKGMDTPLGMERLVHREGKQDEYFTAFQNVRNFLYSTDTKEKELDAIIKMRTKNTKELMSTIYDYVTKYNSHKEKQLNLININKIVFNVVNYTNDINAVNYIPQTDEELKSNKTRKTKDEILQEELAAIEFKFIGGIRVGMEYNASILMILAKTLDKTENDIKSILKEYGSIDLLDK